VRKSGTWSRNSGDGRRQHNASHRIDSRTHRHPGLPGRVSSAAAADAMNGSRRRLIGRGRALAAGGHHAEPGRARHLDPAPADKPADPYSPRHDPERFSMMSQRQDRGFIWRVLCLAALSSGFGGAAAAQTGPRSSLTVTPSSAVNISGPQGGPFSPWPIQYRLSASAGMIKFAIATPFWPEQIRLRERSE
jgi:hypothetical protein